MQPIGFLSLGDGGWIIEEARDQCLLYRKHTGAKTYQVHFAIADDTYVLDRSIQFALEESENDVPASETDAVLAELTRHLRARDILIRVGAA